VNIIKYKEGFKYQLARDFSVFLPINTLDKIIESDYIILNTSGMLEIKKGYAWDGASGIAIDTKNFMRGSLVHDALYQLMREGWLPQDFREKADKILRTIVKEDGMSSIRAWWVYTAVRKQGKRSAKISNAKRVIIAP